jgi:hypothetical protein
MGFRGKANQIYRNCESSEAKRTCLLVKNNYFRSNSKTTKAKKGNSVSLESQANKSLSNTGPCRLDTSRCSSLRPQSVDMSGCGTGNCVVDTSRAVAARCERVNTYEQMCFLWRRISWRNCVDTTMQL